MIQAGDAQWSDSWRRLPSVNIQRKALMDAIRERMGLEGRNRTWLQKEAGISESAMTNYLNHDRDLRYGTIRSIAAALNTTAGALVARAEAREVELNAPGAAQERADAYRAGMSPEAQALLNEAHPRPEPDGDHSHDVG